MKKFRAIVKYSRVYSDGKGKKSKLKTEIRATSITDAITRLESKYKTPHRTDVYVSDIEEVKQLRRV